MNPEDEDFEFDFVVFDDDEEEDDE